MVMHGSDAPPARAVVGPVALAADASRWAESDPRVCRNPYRLSPVRAAPPSAPDRRTPDRPLDRPKTVSVPCPSSLPVCPRCPVVAAAVLLYWRVEFSNVMLTPTVDLVFFHVVMLFIVQHRAVRTSASLRVTISFAI